MPEFLKKSLIIAAKVGLVVLAIFLLIKIGKYIVPFILAYFFASLIEPIVKFIERKLHIPRKIGAIFSILIVLGVIVAMLVFLISRLVIEIRNVYLSLEINMETIALFFNNLLEQINGIYIQLPAEVTNIINKAAQDVANNLQNILKSIIDMIQVPIQIVLYLPQVLIFILVTILATYFMSSDKNAILKYLDGQIPSDWLGKTRSIANNIFAALFGWIRAQLILTTITFTELLIGLLIIGVENALLLALVIAVVDILPVLGAGTVLIPWAIINLFIGNTKLGLSIALLYVIILFVRQLIEPKIVGKQIGVHPLLTLCGMYVGFRLLNVAGMFVGPLSIVALKYILEGILKAETFKNWIERNFRSRGGVILASNTESENHKNNEQ